MQIVSPDDMQGLTEVHSIESAFVFGLAKCSEVQAS